MREKQNKSLFIFRRDLRLEDNTGLIKALESSKYVIPCFIFDPRQVKNNEYKSDNALQFMIESLKDLEQQLKQKNGRLYLLYGESENIVKQITNKENIDALYINRDYTPFSIKRDSAIKDVCRKNNVEFYQYGDALLNEPETILKGDGKPYKVFSAFFRKSIRKKVREPQKNGYKDFFKESIEFEQKNIYSRVLGKLNESIYVRGGRSNCLKILENLEKYANYELDSDYPAKRATTGLAAHNKFGTCSIREVYFAIKDKLGVDHPLIRQLYWRDFFTYVAYHFPHVFGKSFYQKYDKIKWSNDLEKFKAWCEGRTGFPIVDAGMRELNTTGYMNNRLRMIVASFLVKDLHIDWRWGEKYFAQKLVDYDPSVNNGNWQWVASTGCDAQPYFRIFNPWLQQKKHDPECEYIKKWIPELKDVPPKLIHKLYNQKLLKDKKYPRPLVDHSKESKIAKNTYAMVK